MVGEQVSVNHPDYPGVWTVVKRGPVNSLLTNSDTGGTLRRVRVPHTLLMNPGEERPPTPHLLYVQGELARITDGRWAGLYVVIADNGGDKVNLAKLGGDGGRYLRAIRYGLTKVDPAEVLRNDYQQI